MAATPRFKVYRNGEYVASCKYAEDAAMMIALSNGGDIRDGRNALKIVWREGSEDFSASESPDMAAQVIMDRAF